MEPGRIDREVQRPIGYPGSSREGFLRRRYSTLPPTFCYYWSRKQRSESSSRDAKRRYGSALAEPRLEDPAAVDQNRR